MLTARRRRAGFRPLGQNLSRSRKIRLRRWSRRVFGAKSFRAPLGPASPLGALTLFVGRTLEGLALGPEVVAGCVGVVRGPELVRDSPGSALSAAVLDFAGGSRSDLSGRAFGLVTGRACRCANAKGRVIADVGGVAGRVGRVGPPAWGTTRCRWRWASGPSCPIRSRNRRSCGRGRSRADTSARTRCGWSVRRLRCRR